MSNRNDLALREINEGASRLATAISLLCKDEEEAEDLIRRLTAIVSQLIEITGTRSSISFDEHVAESVKIHKHMRAMFDAAEGVQP